MKKLCSRALLLALALSFCGPVLAVTGASLLKVNLAIAMVARVHEIQKKLQGPGAAPLPLAAPAPQAGGSGAYVSPFTAQGEVTTWAQTGMKASVAGAVGGDAGYRASSMATGSLLSRMPGSAQLSTAVDQAAEKKAQEMSAVMLMGGWDAIRSSSDYSFNSADDLAVFMHAYHVDHPDYPGALAAAMALYPELEQRYEPAVELAIELADARHEQMPESQSQLQQLATPEPVIEPQPASEAYPGWQILEMPEDTQYSVDESTTAESGGTVEPAEAEVSTEEVIRDIVDTAGSEQAAGTSPRQTPEPVQVSGDTALTVEQRLEINKRARLQGELTGDEYLAERRRIIYGY